MPSFKSIITSLFIPFQAHSMTVDLINRNDFVNKYGDKATPYKALDSFGGTSPNVSWPFIVCFVFILIGAFAYTGSENDIDINTGKKIERSNFKKFLFSISILSLFIVLFGFIYGIYLFFFVYKVQYKLWYNGLPLEARLDLMTINYNTDKSIIMEREFNRIVK